MPQSKTRKTKKYGVGGAGSFGPTVELELPSIDEETGEHNIALVRRVGTQGLIAVGILDDMDSLTSLVSGKLNQITGEMNPEQLKAIAEASPQINTAMDLIDKIALYAIVQPRVLPIPRPVKDEETGETHTPERIEGALYIDVIDLDDKLFIMHFVVGGSADLSEFRNATQAYVGGVEDVEDVRLPSE